MRIFPRTKSHWFGNFESLGNLRLGFYGSDVYVTEGVTTRQNHLGTCVLLQNPATWGEEDTCNWTLSEITFHNFCTFRYVAYRPYLHTESKILNLVIQAYLNVRLLPEENNKHSFYREALAFERLDTAKIDSIFLSRADVFLREMTSDISVDKIFIS